MADVIDPPAALEVASIDLDVRSVSRRGEPESGFPVRGKQRVFFVHRNDVAEYAARSDLRQGMVVVKTDLRVRTDIRPHIEVSKRVEPKLLGGPSEVVIGSKGE